MDHKKIIRVNAIDHINMSVNSLEESISFYEKLFGFEIIEDSRNGSIPPNKFGAHYVIMGIKQCAYLALHQSLQKGDGQHNGSPIRLAHFGFHVEDFDRVIAKLKTHSVSFLYGEKYLEWAHSRSVYILDPSKHEIELVEHFGGRETK
jgi:lactoylglutathione lyase